MKGNHDKEAEALRIRIARLEEENRILQTENQRLKKENAKLAKKASTDPLTGLPNRAIMEEKRTHSTKDTSVILVDLDKFKPINDTHGHDVGDQLLIWFGEVLEKNVRLSDTVVRLGGDEFVIILTGASRKKAEEISSNIMLKLTEDHFDFDGGSIMVEASFGVASAENKLMTLDELMKQADKAMYKQKKEKGAGR